MSADENRYITVELAVTVQVDPTDDELLDRYDESSGQFSVADVVRSEVQSNLESVSYVRHVAVIKSKGGET